MLIFNRQTKVLELYRHQDAELGEVGRSTPVRPDVLSSKVLHLDFCLRPGEPRPQVEVHHKVTGERWFV